MIGSFRSKMLKRFWDANARREINPHHIYKVEMILTLLEAAERPEAMNVQGLDFHKLSNEKPPRWSVHVNGNWCITFSFEGDDAVAVDYEDYH